MRQRSSSSDFPWLEEDEFFRFPEPQRATPEGILASGGNLSPGMLISAYRQGVFPWYSDNDPILWWCPDPRFVVFLSEIHVSKSMRKVLRKRRFRVTIDCRFEAVIDECAKTPRAHQSGTWITDDMRAAYVRLHQLGYAHSCEAWDGDELVGGLYGVAVGKIFFGESMFSHFPNASKTAFILLARFLQSNDFTLMDSQVRTAHVETLGGKEIPRGEFLELVRAHTARPGLEDWSSQFHEESVVKAAVADELS